jgi:hypothetical protein
MHDGDARLNDVIPPDTRARAPLLHCRRALAEAGGAAALPAALSISLGRPRQRDAAASALRDSVYALLRSYGRCGPGFLFRRLGGACERGVERDCCF